MTIMWFYNNIPNIDINFNQDYYFVIACQNNKLDLLLWLIEMNEK